jgi:hypothetical protein
MVTLVVQNKYDPVVWDRQASELGGEFFHSYASTIYRAKLAGGQTLFALAQGATGHCVGIAAGVIATSHFWPFSKYCRVASFAATPTANGDLEIENWLLKHLEMKLRDLGVFRIEFDSYHSRNSVELLPAHGYNIIDRHEYSFDLTINIDELFAAISSTKRKHYRNAEKRGIVTCELNSYEAVELVEYFRNLALERRDLTWTKKAARISEARHELFDSGCTRVLVSYLDDKPVGACIFGIFNNRVYAFRSGSSDEGNANYSPVHLYWTAIKLFKSEGYLSLGLGGAKESEAGIRQFKQMLGAVESCQPCGYKVLAEFGAKLDGIRRKLR